MGEMGQHKVHTTDRLEQLWVLMQQKEDVNVQPEVFRVGGSVWVHTPFPL